MKPAAFLSWGPQKQSLRQGFICGSVSGSTAGKRGVRAAAGQEAAPSHREPGLGTREGMFGILTRLGDSCRQPGWGCQAPPPQPLLCAGHPSGQRAPGVGPATRREPGGHHLRAEEALGTVTGIHARGQGVPHSPPRLKGPQASFQCSSHVIIIIIF